jgi:hypothetical protein
MFNLYSDVLQDTATAPESNLKQYQLYSFQMLLSMVHPIWHDSIK